MYIVTRDHIKRVFLALDNLFTLLMRVLCKFVETFMSEVYVEV